MEPTSQVATQSKRPRLPIGVRSIIFSYFDLMTIIRKMASISKQDLEMLQNSQNLDQKRCLVVAIQELMNIKPKQLSLCAQLASEFLLHVSCLKDQNYVYIAETIFEKVENTDKKISLMIDVKENVRAEQLRNLFENRPLQF